MSRHRTFSVREHQAWIDRGRPTDRRTVDDLLDEIAFRDEREPLEVERLIPEDARRTGESEGAR